MQREEETREHCKKLERDEKAEAKTEGHKRHFSRILTSNTPLIIGPNILACEGDGGGFQQKAGSQDGGAEADRGAAQQGGHRDDEGGREGEGKPL